MFPALAGGFLTTAPRGKPHKQVFLKGSSQVCYVNSSAQMGRQLKGGNRAGGCSRQREKICRDPEVRKNMAYSGSSSDYTIIL